ncbi:ribonuclease E activity regulator RraA [Aquimarina gracilis]|uniref:4-hydroxy-4-methyl-2-oxoglutarate aldolase n=1 Tax=Aquimarina gracilis TaxID=874422 RepID=A0ABU5ZWQ1_9FLAO|nr:ribonuclease E activity regulator RraA [Aquimarina gracilis]MEB3346298.1 ribonuclease E activity regulator RraA [Aquimarina gracilis]
MAELTFQTADLSDQYPNDLLCASPIFKSFGKKTAFWGEITTIKLFEDNSFVRQQLGTDGTGKVLVVDGGGSLRCALVGDRLAQLAIDNNWEGIIVYGCIRDSRIINEMNVGIRAINTCPIKSIKRNIGELDIPVKFAEIEFTPGNFIYVDEDGILTSPKKLL